MKQSVYLSTCSKSFVNVAFMWPAECGYRLFILFILLVPFIQAELCCNTVKFHFTFCLTFLIQDCIYLSALFHIKRTACFHMCMQHDRQTDAGVVAALGGGGGGGLTYTYEGRCLCGFP